MTYIFNTIKKKQELSLFPQTKGIHNSFWKTIINIRYWYTYLYPSSLTFLNSFLHSISFNNRVNRFVANRLDGGRVRLIDSRLVHFRDQRFRASQCTGSCQAVWAIASGSDLLVVALLRYTQTFGRTDGAVDAGRRCPRTLSIGTVLGRRATWCDITATTG